MLKLYKKTSKVRLCKGLSTQEYSCKCSNNFCKTTVISKNLIKSYSSFRNLIGVRLLINSGYRCQSHNHNVGGAELSRHLTGEAIDINLKSLHHLDNDEIEFAAKNSGFNFIKFYKSFVHLDVRN